MNHLGSYQSGRRFLPYGWGTPSPQCCGPCMGRNNGRSNPPIIVPACPFNQPGVRKYGNPSGINTAAGPAWTKNEYDFDKCRDRRWTAPNSSPAPINVQLKMYPAGPAGDQCCGQQQEQPRFESSAPCCPTVDDMAGQCSNLEQPNICPPGNKAERTRPILPRSNFLPHTDKVNLSTTYQSDFLLKELGKTKSFGPSRIVKPPTGEFVIDSCYRNDFRWHNVTKFEQARWVRDKLYKMPTEPMNVISSYRTDYQIKVGKPAQSAKRKALYDANPPHLDDTTTYKVEFIPHCLPEKFVRKTNDDIQYEVTNVGDCVPFDGITVYRRDYQKFKPCKIASMKQYQTPQPYGGLIDDKTTYRCSYEPYYFDNDDCMPPQEYKSVYPCSK